MTAENAVVVAEPEQDEMSKPLQNVEETIQRRTGYMPSNDGAPDVPLRFAEKKRLHWTGKTCGCHQFSCETELIGNNRSRSSHHGWQLGEACPSMTEVILFNPLKAISPSLRRFRC